MAFPLEAVETPVRFDENGIAYVADTTVRLTSVLSAYLNDDSPEDIVESYPAIRLADVYGVIAYYLNHRQAMDSYLIQQSQLSAATRQAFESEHPEMTTLQKRLRALKYSQSKS
jgi:uncharacterized protein (DUF433 family)